MNLITPYQFFDQVVPRLPGSPAQWKSELEIAVAEDRPFKINVGDEQLVISKELIVQYLEDTTPPPKPKKPRKPRATKPKTTKKK